MQKEVRTGLWAVVIFATFVVGLNYLKGKNVFTSKKSYYAVFQDINGLQISSPVMTNGMTVGYVGRIELLQGDIQHIVVEIDIDKSFTVPANSVMEICNADLLGTKAVRLILGDSPMQAASGDTLQSALQSDILSGLASRLGPAADKAAGMLVALDTLIGRLNQVLDPTTQQHIQQLVAETDAMMSEARPKVNALLQDLTSLSGTLRAQETHLAGLMEHADAVATHLAETDFQTAVDGVTATLAQLQTTLNQLNAGKGTLGQLIENPDLYNNLNKSLSDLDLLLQDVREHPGRFVRFSVFGGKENN